MSGDVDWGSRMDLLCELMEQEPHKSVARLQRETLKYYPLLSSECIRHWMSKKTAFHAAKILNRPMEEAYEKERQEAYDRALRDAAGAGGRGAPDVPGDGHEHGANWEVAGRIATDCLADIRRQPCSQCEAGRPCTCPRSQANRILGGGR